MINTCNLVAVYGSLRKGLGNHRVLGDSPFKYEGVIKNASLYDYCNGGFPAVSLEGESDVVVEVYEVLNENTADALDCLEGYPSFYNREVVNVYSHSGGLLGRAWVYHIEEDLSPLPLVAHGDWKSYKREIGHL